MTALLEIASLEEVFQSMASSHENKLIRFTCDSCGTKLTVDASLAGVEGPCPKCGERIKAPNPVEEPPVEPVPEKEKSPILQESTPQNGFKKIPGNSSSSSGRTRKRRSSGSSSGGRKVDATGGYSMKESESNELFELGKILLSVVGVAIAVVFIVWWAKNQ